MRRSEKGHFECLIVIQLRKLLLGLLRVDDSGRGTPRKEHRFFVSKSAHGGKQPGSDSPVGLIFVRPRLSRHSLPQGRLCRIQICRQLHSRHVQRLSCLVKVVSFAVFRKDVFNIQQRHLQQVAQVVLVFLPVKPADGAAAPGGYLLAVYLQN